MKEEWRWIPGYENRYKLSSRGRVKSYLAWKPREIKPVGTPGWYPGISLCKDRAAKRFHLHRLMALTFIPNPDQLATVNHKNGDKEDYRLENLEWMSNEDNMKHAWRMGFMRPAGAKGEAARSAKLTEEKVHEIRLRYQRGVNGKGQFALAREYGVSSHAIYDVVKRRTWRHVA